MEPGGSLGPYRLDRELGSGGMGKVYAATGPEGVVALKIVHPHLLETPGFSKRFQREAQIGASIRHPNVVSTLAGDELDGTHVLVMEYVEGQTLSALLGELERVPEQLCRHIAREICKGLEAIHGEGVVHRDVKPENVIISLRASRPARPAAEPVTHLGSGDAPTRPGHARDDVEHVVKIMDLGIALLIDEQVRLSRTGAFVGSVEYASPEQFRGGAIDARTDLHALGVLLYEISSGQHPYRGGGLHEIMQRVCETDPRPLGQVNPQLSPFLEEVVHTLLVKDPRGRFASATQLLTVLDDGEDSAWWRERSRVLRLETRRPLRRIRIPRETAVYGREKELARLRELYTRASSGDGQVVLLEGEAGIGKSRLVDELVARLHAAGEELSFLFGSYPPGGGAAAVAAFSGALHEHLGEGSVAPYMPLSPLLVPAFDALLRGDAPPPGAQPLDRNALTTCFAHALRGLAAERVTIVLIDDLHFAPGEARALFSALAMAVPGHRVLLIGSTRPGAPEQWRADLTRLDQTTPIDVSRLGPKDLVTLLGDSLGSPQLAQDLGGKIALKSDGNPFFVFEIVRALREGSVLTQRADGTWQTTGVIDDIEIPSSVLDLVNARVADLSPDERDLLDIACCMGFEFDPLLIGNVLGIGRIPLLKQLAQIERGRRLVRSAGVLYVFDHHQVQEALYRSLSELLRREYHAALAEALEARTNAVASAPESLDGAVCADICEHYLRGDRGGPALRYLGAAQTHLAVRSAHARSADLDERALAIPGLLAGSARGEVLLRLAVANGPLDLLGRRARQEECAREALRLAEEGGDDLLLARTSMALATVLWRTARHEEAKEAYERARELARVLGDKRIEASATGNLGQVHFNQGRVTEAKEMFERASALCREQGDRAGEARGVGNIGNVFLSQGRLPEARAQFETWLAISREIGPRESEAAATINLGIVARQDGRIAEAQELLERGREICREIGHRQYETNATGTLSNIFTGLGRMQEARAQLEHYLVIAREIGDRNGEAIGLCNLGLLLHQMGEADRGEEHLLASAALLEAAGNRRALASTHVSIGALRARRSLEQGGDGADARPALAIGLEMARETHNASAELSARCWLARLAGEGVDAALAALTAHEESLPEFERREARLLLFQATGDPAHIAEAKRLLDDALAHAPEEYHDAIRRNVRLNREVLAAWRSTQDDDPDDDSPDNTSPTESPTRIA